MKGQVFSINDIARELGISSSTVSRALKDHPDISLPTKQLVRDFAQKVNYRPNILALSLRNRRTNTLGLIIPEIAHHFFSSVISGIEEYAYSNSFRVIICQSNEDPERELVNLNALMEHRVDGIMISASKKTNKFHPFKKIIESGVPVLFFDRISNELTTDRVTTDDFEAARMITSHLLLSGHKNLLHLGASRNMQVGKERYNGFLQAFIDNDVPTARAAYLQCETSEDVNRLQNEILEKVKQGIDGIFAVNDFTAVAAIKLLQYNGYRIPEDIVVAGFGNDPIASIVEPPLTTIEQKGFRMGKECAKLLIERIQNPEKFIQPRTRVFEGSLIKRKSA